MDIDLLEDYIFPTLGEDLDHKSHYDFIPYPLPSPETIRKSTTLVRK